MRNSRATFIAGLSLVLLACALLNAAALEPTHGTKSRLLPEEKIDGDISPHGWHAQAGRLRVADGVLHASQERDAGALSLFNCDLPPRGAAIKLDVKFAATRGGLNASVNPSLGELSKKGHRFSLIITPAMWNITEHNDKACRKTQGQARASAPAKFAPGKWHTLLVGFRGANVIAHVGRRNRCARRARISASRNQGIEFRVLGRNGGEISFDNLRVWELK